MLAFHNDPACKRAALERIKGHMDAGDVVPLPSFWDKGKGGPAGCTVHDADPAAFEQKLGIARGVLPIVEAIFRKNYNTAPPNREALGLDPEEVVFVRNFPFDWLDSIPLGADVSNVPAKMVIWMLGDGEQGTVAAVTDEAVRTVLDGVLAGHRAALDGNPPSASAWAELRRTAMTLADRLPAGSLDALAAVTVESAAWPMTASGSIALDVFDSYVNAFEALAAAQTGWSAEDRALAERNQAHLRARMEAELEGLEDEAWQHGAYKIVQEQRATLAKDHPEFQTKELAFRSAFNDLRWGRVVSCQRALLDFLCEAPVLAAC